MLVFIFYFNVFIFIFLDKFRAVASHPIHPSKSTCERIGRFKYISFSFKLNIIQYCANFSSLRDQYTRHKIRERVKSDAKECLNSLILTYF